MRVGKSVSFITLDFKFAVFEPQIAAALNRLSPAVAACTADALHAWKRIFRLSLRQKRSPEPLLPLRIDAMLKSAALGLVSENGVAGTDASAADTDHFQMAAYLNEHLDRQVTLEQLAERFNFHPHYIIELFRRHTGTTPIRYHQLLRLGKVKEQLEFTNRTVSEIAEQVGWSLPYLSRLFQSQEGMSATAYREYTKEAIDRDLVMDEQFVNTWRLYQEDRTAPNPKRARDRSDRS